MKNNEFIFNVGRRIAQIRRLRDISQYELAEKSGKMINTISKLERGVGDPKISTLKDIAIALEVDLLELIDVSSEKKLDYKRSNEAIINNIIKTFQNFDEYKLHIIEKQIKAFI